MKPYDGDLISEEEFIYDGLNIEPLYQVLTNSLKCEIFVFLLLSFPQNRRKIY
jgi:hypothetical protein